MKLSRIQKTILHELKQGKLLVYFPHSHLWKFQYLDLAQGYGPTVHLQAKMFQQLLTFRLIEKIASSEIIEFYGCTDEEEKPG